MKKSSKLTVVYRIEPDGSPQTAIGRRGWALKELLNAGDIGCTPITHPGPRWSGYVHRLREAGIIIETINESHGGKFAGTHARYRLRSQITIISDNSSEESAEMAA